MNTQLPDRLDYVSGKLTHRQYYRQLAAAIGVSAQDLPVSETVLLTSHDPSFNDIPLKYWDAKHELVRNKAARAGAKAWSLSDSVCVLKAVAADLLCRPERDTTG